ncbi:T-complex protein 11-domain-containing protein, partial [Umbelopsis sp. AD052]
DFQELVGKLKDPELITAAGTVLAQGQTKLDKKKARTFLTAFMIVSCPSAILLDIESKQEQSLLQAAKTLLHAFQEWLEAAHTNKFDSKWYAFEDCWNSYYALFEAWKSKDVEKLVDNLITHYIELERLWDTLGKDADNASEIRSQLDEQQLQISQKLLKVGGPQAQQKLDTAKKTIELAREEAQKRSQRERADSVLSVPSSPTPRAEKVHQATAAESSTSRTSSHSDDLARILGSFSPAVGITNEQLAHEVVMNPDFKLEKNGKSELVDQVRDIATKAFFDSMREDFANKNYQRWIPGLVGDMKQRLLSLAPATSKIHQDVNDTLDLALIAQQINAETYNVDNTVHFVIRTMEKLCAPVRDDAVHAISRAGDLADTFRAILELLDQMNLDLANYRIQALRPYLKEISIEYEREKFSTALMNGKIGLVKTRDWLRTASISLQGIAGQRNPEGIEDVESNIKFTDVYNEALASLLSSSEALLPDSCPETLLLDVERITGYQNEAQAITIVAALLMLTKNFSSADESSRHRTSTPAMKALRDKLFVLLEAKDTTVENLSLQVIQSIQ